MSIQGFGRRRARSFEQEVACRPKLTHALRLLIAVSAGIVAASGLPNPGISQTRGGDLVVVQAGAPGTFDAMTTGSQYARNINMNIFEMLMTRDENANPVPDLATKFEESADGLTYVFKLREGVKFHNGKEMTSQDVKGSMERYFRVGWDRGAYESVQAVESTDKHTVTVRLKIRVPSFIDQISSPRSPMIIIPSEESEKPIGRIAAVGTGPFQLVEFVGDSHVKLRRFNDYKPNEAYSDVNGLAGRKIAYVDTVTFRSVPEPNSRVAALQAGEAHISEQIPNVSAKTLKNNQALKVMTLMPWSMEIILFNAGNGPTANLNVRRAIQAALNADEIMTIGTDGVYRLDHGFNYPESIYWAGDVGKDVYNQNNPRKAQALLKDANYQREPIVLVVTSQIEGQQDIGVAIGEQLKAVGINFQLRVVDDATSEAIGSQATGWNMYINGFGVAPWVGPYGLPAFFTGKSAWIYHNDDMLAAANANLRSKPTLAERQDAVKTFWARVHDQAYGIRLGDIGLSQAARAEVKGFKPYRVPRAWGVWLEK